MLLAVDVGNSHTVSGVFSQNTLLHKWRLKSDRDRTADELAMRYHALFQMAGLNKEQINGCIIASVVPTLESSWLTFTSEYFTNCSSPPLAVSHRTDTGITIKTKNPAEVGADRIVNAVAAWERFNTPLLVVDFGTAITFDCVSGNGEYLGGTIHPGIGISLDALAGRTAKLPRIDIDIPPKNAIGQTTAEAIRSGILHGFGGMIDRMVGILQKEIAPAGEDIHIIATGGMAHLIAPYSSSLAVIDPLLTLNGLLSIYQKNKSQP